MRATEDEKKRIKCMCQILEDEIKAGVDEFESD